MRHGRCRGNTPVKSRPGRLSFSVFGTGPGGGGRQPAHPQPRVDAVDAAAETVHIQPAGGS